jgi:hypothetical protein
MARKTFTAGEVLTAANVNTFLSNEQKSAISTATAYTVETDDRYEALFFTSGSAVTVTLSTATAFEQGERVDIIADGAGVVTVSAGSGVTLAGKGTAVTSFTIEGQYEAATVICQAADVYRIIGNVAAV